MPGSTEGMSAQGTKIARSPDPNWPPTAPIGGAVAFTDIAELRDITPPPKSRNGIELTTHNEQDDRWVVGIRRKGEMTFNMNFAPANTTHDHLTGLNKDWQDGLRKIWRVTYPDGTQWMFSGFVSNIADSAPVDDRLASDVTIRPTGSHQWVAAP